MHVTPPNMQLKGEHYEFTIQTGIPRSHPREIQERVPKRKIYYTERVLYQLRVSPQACYQTPKQLQILHKTKAQEKRKKISL